MRAILHYFEQGGVLMWPLLACSLLGVAVIFERLARLRRGVLIDAAVVEDIQTLCEKGQLKEAANRHHNSPVLVGRILSRGLDEHLHANVPIETALLDAGERGLQILPNNLGVLVLISKVAPLLGLLGTVLGMILGFEALEQSGVGKEQLAHAIRVALVTTAAGLMVAIPCVVALAYFRGRIRRLQAEFEEILLSVVKSVKTARPTPTEKTEAIVPGGAVR